MVHIMSEFRPFVPSLAAKVREALTALLGLPPEQVLQLELERTSRSDDWVAALTVVLSGREVVLDLFDARNPRQAWTRSSHFALAYRHVDGADPFAHPATALALNGLKQRLTTIDRAGTREADEARAALADYLPFSALTDDSFRLLFGDGAQRTLALWLGFGCDQNCYTCWQSRSWPEPPRDWFRSWLDQGISAGAKCLILSGGEPTLHPSLPELLARAKAAGLHTVLETNALRLSEPGTAERLRTTGVDELFVSLHAGDARTSDTLTQVEGSFLRTVAGIRAGLGAGLPTSLQCVVERMTAPGLAQQARFVVETFVKPPRAEGRPGVRSVTYSFPTQYLDAARFRGALVPFDELRPSLSEAIRVLRENGVEARFVGMSGLPLCASDAPRNEAARLGPATAQDRQSKGYAAPCDRCLVRTYCPGVPDAYRAIHGERGLLPVTSAC
jgi:hypothetical protein